MHISQTELATRLANATQNVTVGGIYAHYKNPDQSYEVIGVAITEATNEPCVIYKAQYGENITFVRPLTNWLEYIDLDGAQVPRFTKAEPQTS